MIGRAVICIALSTVLVLASVRWIQSFDSCNKWKKDEIMHETETKMKSQGKEISPACGLREGNGRIDRIVFLHMRKAGGTTIWSYLRDVAEKHAITLESYEGLSPPSPQERDPSTLFVTHIRDPVARVISHYKYEMRWNCKNLTNKKQNFTPTENNTRMSLNHFIKNSNRPMFSGNLKGHLWECSHNCYAKWSTGLCLHEGPYNDSQYCWSLNSNRGSFLYEARQSLWNYNFIFVTEWLKNPDYVQTIETMFDTPGLSNRQTLMWCGAQSMAANQLIPLVVTAEQEKTMNNLNQIDRILYQELTMDCQEKFHFPNQTLHWVSPIYNNGTAQILIYK
jgi:hypothetical protein